MVLLLPLLLFSGVSRRQWGTDRVVDWGAYCRCTQSGLDHIDHRQMHRRPQVAAATTATASVDGSRGTCLRFQSSQDLCVPSNPNQTRD